MKTTFNDKFMAGLALFAGIAISCVAEFYSVMGLIAIYPAALIPVIIMGIVLGIGKLSATVWLKQSWSWSPVWLKLYILPAIALLMMITSIGVFGFLSKSHSDQSLVSGDVQAKIAVYDEKIKNERENIDVNRKALKQLDESVDQVMGRSSDEKGAEKAVAIRKAQQKERGRLTQDIAESQKKISALNESRAPIAAEVRKIEAEVGPIKYIAGFIYGSNPDANILEKSVSWVSILIVLVLDPLAIMLLLASQYSFQRMREMETVESLPQEATTDDPVEFPKNTDRLETVDFISPHPGEGKETLVETLLGGQATDGEIAQINQALSKFVNVFNENKTDEPVTAEEKSQPLVPETVDTPPVPTKVLEDANVRRTKVFPKKTAPAEPEAPHSPFIPDQAFKEIMEAKPAPATRAPGVPPDYEDGDYVVINGERFHKKAVPSGYIQNEEQQESNLWSNTVSNNNPQAITPQQYIDTVKNSI
jgi:energy-converting hydrogenase Eha subunit A